MKHGSDATWLVACAALAAGCTVTTLTPIEPLPAAATPEATRTAIQRALDEHGWQVVGEEAGRVYAERRRNDAMARIAISHDDHVHVAYMDSENLAYERRDDGVEFISPTYDGWLVELVRTLKARLAATP